MKKILQSVLLLTISFGYILNVNAEMSEQTKAKLNRNIEGLNNKLDIAINGDLQKADNFSEVLLKKFRDGNVKNENIRYLLERVIKHLQEFHGIKNEKDTGSKYYEKISSGINFWNYYGSENLSFGMETYVYGADVGSFQGLDGKYAKDKNNVYYQGKSITHRDYKTKKYIGADTESFIPIDEYYSKDKNTVYGMFSGYFVDMTGWNQDYGYGGTVGIADPKTFQSLSHGYGKDKSKIFRGIFEIGGADLKTFEVINNIYSKDKNYVYYETYPYKVDQKTFEVIDNYYSKDKNNVYQSNEVIKGTDPKTFITPVGEK